MCVNKNCNGVRIGARGSCERGRFTCAPVSWFSVNERRKTEGTASGRPIVLCNVYLLLAPDESRKSSITTEKREAKSGTARAAPSNGVPTTEHRRRRPTIWGARDLNSTWRLLARFFLHREARASLSRVTRKDDERDRTSCDNDNRPVFPVRATDLHVALTLPWFLFCKQFSFQFVHSFLLSFFDIVSFWKQKM